MIVKVCGMREEQNIRDVEALGVDLIGHIYYTKSSRYVSQTVNRDRAQNRVGVFVDERFDNIIEIAKRDHLTLIQCHGIETPSECAAIKREGYKVIKAIAIGGMDDIIEARGFENHVDYLLFDTKSSSKGGSGIKFPWQILSTYQGNTPFLLSGGISPFDATVIKEFAHPMMAGIDLNSCFEDRPAIKNIELLRNFLNQIR